MSFGNTLAAVAGFSGIRHGPTTRLHAGIVKPAKEQVKVMSLRIVRTRKSSENCGLSDGCLADLPPTIFGKISNESHPAATVSGQCLHTRAWPTKYASRNCFGFCTWCVCWGAVCPCVLVIETLVGPRGNEHAIQF